MDGKRNIIGLRRNSVIMYPVTSDTFSDEFRVRPGVRGCYNITLTRVRIYSPRLFTDCNVINRNTYATCARSSSKITTTKRKKKKKKTSAENFCLGGVCEFSHLTFDFLLTYPLVFVVWRRRCTCPRLRTTFHTENLLVFFLRFRSPRMYYFIVLVVILIIRIKRRGNGTVLRQYGFLYFKLSFNWGKNTRR